MSNRYIFRYAIILVIIVAAVLSATSMLLKPYQTRNQNIEKMQNILSAAGVPDVNSDNAQELFSQYCTHLLVINGEGEVIEDCKEENPSKCSAFNISLKQELYDKSVGKPYQLPLFIIQYGETLVNVIPLEGTGLWGPIWGYIAIGNDYSTVKGAVFDHKSETPGLGGEITTAKFQKQFIGKTLFKDGMFVSINVQKGGVMSLPEAERAHSVDAISGGTVTSNGVNEMIRNVLENYLPYFMNQLQQQ